MTEHRPPELSHNEALTRYEAHLEGAVAGFAEYQLAGELLVLTHTEVEPRFEGRGVGSALARFALDDARRRSVKVLPMCPFIKAWLGRHPDYGDVVYGTRPARSTE